MSINTPINQCPKCHRVSSSSSMEKKLPTSSELELDFPEIGDCFFIITDKPRELEFPEIGDCFYITTDKPRDRGDDVKRCRSGERQTVL